LAQLSDEQLFEKYRGGDMPSMRILVERHLHDLLAFLTRMMGDRAGAEDVFQDTFLQIHQAAATFDATRRFRPWLFTIAANKARDHLRRKGRRRTLDLSAPISGGRGGGDDSPTEFVDLLEIDIPAPSAGIEAEEQSRLVQEALETLPPSLKEILLLAYFQRLSYAQIAEDLEIPLGTVKSRLHAAVATFSKRWTERHGRDGRPRAGESGTSHGGTEKTGP
jgi:RNA polymerase sigma-70 factor (ECF subfamily)